MQKHKKITGVKFKSPNTEYASVTSLSALMRACFSTHAKRFEPVKRWQAGVFRFASHKYPIKGGVDLSHIMFENVSKNNALIRMLAKKGSHAHRYEITDIGPKE